LTIFLFDTKLISNVGNPLVDLEITK